MISSKPDSGFEITSGPVFHLRISTGSTLLFGNEVAGKCPDIKSFSCKQFISPIPFY
jgi:hypothetical protein